MHMRLEVKLYLWAYMNFDPSYPYFFTNLGGLWYIQSPCKAVEQLYVSGN